MVKDFYKKLEAAGHKLRLNLEGEVDIWVLDSGFHNGPGCSLCGLSWCHHCGATGEVIVRPCTGGRGFVLQ